MLPHLKKATNNVTVRTIGIFPPAEWSWEKKSVFHFGLDWLMEKHQLNCQSCDEKCCRQCPRGVNWIRNVELKNVNTEEKISLNERTQSLVKTQFCWKVIPSNLTVPRCSSEPEHGLLNRWTSHWAFRGAKNYGWGAGGWDPNHTPGVDFLGHNFLSSKNSG